MTKERRELGRPGNSPVFFATKKGKALRLERDPDPATKQYMVMDAPGMLLLFPKSKNGDKPVELPEFLQEPRSSNGIDRDAQLRRAFDALKSRVSQTVWAESAKPYSALIDGLRRLHGQDAVREDVSAYLSANPAVGNAIEMFFTSVAMSTRADWRASPTSMRGVMARGWFLDRWVPTFLVLDGPILRFLKSHAFRRQNGGYETLRAVRAFFEDRDFMRLRHAFAHWSFTWNVIADDSEIVGSGKTHGDEVRMLRSEVDAFHIITFAVVDAIYSVFMEKASAPQAALVSPEGTKPANKVQRRRKPG